MGGGVIAGWLFSHFGHFVFLIAIAPVLLAWFVLGSYACPHKQHTQKNDPAPDQNNTNRSVAAGLLATFSAASLAGLLGGVFPAFGITIGVDARIFGFLLACSGLGRTALFLAGIRWSGFTGEWRFVFIIQAGAAFLVAGIAFIPALWWLVTTFLVAGVCLGACYYRGLLSILEIRGPRGFKTGLFESTLLFGIMLGGFFGGYLANTYGLHAPYPVVAGLTFLFILLQSFLILPARREGNV